jgi:Mrp family chromosome partitioning ATPase/NifU-like protein involved in Fe-S cluster formation
MKTRELPLNFGPLKGANGNARLTDSYGDTVEFWITVQDRVIVSSSFVTDGCEYAVTCCSMASSLIEGKAPCVASTITKEQILQESSLSNEYERYAILAIATIAKAVDNYKLAHKPTCPNSGGCGESHHDSPSASKCDKAGQCGASNSANSTCGSSCNSDAGDCNKETDRPQNRLPNIKHKIAVISGKGGVGKSTIATNLAFTLAASGYKVGLLDADIHGPSIPIMLNLTEANIEVDSEGITPIEIGNLKVISIGFFLKNSAEALIWRGPVKIGIINQLLYEVKWGELDFLIIDLPPGTGDEPLSIGQALSSKNDGAVIVTTPQEVASSDVRKSITFCQTMKIPILGIIENMSGFVCPHCETVTNIFGSNGGRELANVFGIDLLGEIPIDPAIVLTSDAGRPYMDINAQNRTTVVFKQAIDSILKAIERS